MELQAVLVLCGVGVATVAVFLLMGLFSSSGTSYEEAIAQQRKATTELLALAESKNKSKKNNKKASKKQAKKEKKENVAATGSEPESEAPAESGMEDETEPTKIHVEFSEDVLVETPRDSPPNIKIRKRGKDTKVKPILVNKDDPSCLSDPVALSTPAANVTNHFEELHPKDEFELLLSQSTLATEKPQEKNEEVAEKKESKPAKSKGKGPVKTAPAPAPTPVAEPPKENVARERHNSGDAPKEQRKAKKIEKKIEKPVEEVVVAPREEVVPPLNAPQPSELTTEKLLKQALVTPTAPAAATSTPPGGKKKKKAEPNVLALMAGDSGGVNVSELVRVVREAALSRTEIQILTDALLNKHHDPLPEHAEWTEGPNDPMQKLKKQLADKEKALSDEIEASQGFQAKLKELRASLNAERSRVTTVNRASEQAAAAARAEMHTLQTRLHRLMEENHMLQTKLGVEGEAQAQRVQMEMHIQRLSEGEAALMQQIAALTAARDGGIMAQQHAAEMAQQLQEANRAYADLDQQRQMAMHAEQRAQKELHQLQERLAGMAELQNEIQRLSARAQVAENNNDKIMEEAEKNSKRLSSEITSLGEQLAARESELSELKQMKAVPAQNGLMNDAHKAAELAKVECVVESLRSELAAAQRGSLEQREQLSRLNDQLQAYQDKNNELRTKNWKVMEALQSAEKALQAQSPSALSAQELREAILKAQEAQYTEVALVLRAASPALAPRATAGRAWLQAFADNLRAEFAKRDAEKTELENKLPKAEAMVAATPCVDRLAELQSEKEHLQGLVDKYKKIIEEKEAAPIAGPCIDRLAELQSKNIQLQASVDKYKQIIDEKEASTVAGPCVDRLAELETEKNELQSLVDNYKKVIYDTEGVLSRLQHNVSTEEERWAKQLADKQHELDELRHKTVLQMQQKIDSLEAQLLREKTSNHNHSFAEAERCTEEKLMAGLSEKLNGPSQVELQKM